MAKEDKSEKTDLDSTFYVSKDKHLKKIRAWIHDLDSLRNTKLGELKIVRQEHNQLAKLLDEAIIDDNLPLFPEAGVKAPSSLSAGQRFWVIADFLNKDKSVGLKIEVAALDNGEFLHKWKARNDEDQPDGAWMGSCTSKEQATRDVLHRIRNWMANTPSDRVGLKTIGKALDKVEADLGASILPLPPNWKAPRLHLMNTGVGAMALQGATLPSQWPASEVPQIAPLTIDGKKYSVCLKASEAGSTIKEWLAVELADPKTWPFKTVGKQSDALDGFMCGLQVSDPDNNRWVINQQSTSVVLWEWEIHKLEELEDAYGMDIKAKVLKDVDKGLLTRLQVGTNIDVEPTHVFFMAEQGYLNTGPASGEMTESLTVLLPLIEPKVFARRFPKHVVPQSLDKSAWFGLRCVAMGRDGQSCEWVIGPPSEAKIVRMAGTPTLLTETFQGEAVPATELAKDADDDEDFAHLTNSQTMSQGEVAAAVREGRVKSVGGRMKGKR